MAAKSETKKASAHKHWGGAKKKAGVKKASPKKASPKKASPKKASPKKLAKVPVERRRRAPGQASALSEEEQRAILALQEELGIPGGYRPESEDELRRVLAHHEAGHAVVGHLLGRTLRAVSVTQHCEFEPIGKMSETELENSIKIALAGPHAEVLASEDKVSVGGGGDLPRARAEAENLAGDDWRARLDALSAASQALVMEHWAAIERIAGRLVEFAEVVRQKDLQTLLE